MNREERKEQEIAAFGTTARVHMGKGDKRGTRISTSKVRAVPGGMVQDLDLGACACTYQVDDVQIFRLDVCKIST